MGDRNTVKRSNNAEGLIGRPEVPYIYIRLPKGRYFSAEWAEGNVDARIPPSIHYRRSATAPNPTCAPSGCLDLAKSSKQALPRRPLGELRPNSTALIWSSPPRDVKQWKSDRPRRGLVPGTYRSMRGRSFQQRRRSFLQRHTDNDANCPLSMRFTGQTDHHEGQQL